MNASHSLSLLLLASLLACPAPAHAADASDSSSPQLQSPWTALARGRVEPTGGIVQVAASRDGIVQSMLVSEGQHVTQGQPLARLSDADARLNLSLAQSELSQAQAALAPLSLREAAAQHEIARLAPLVSEQLANAADLDQAREREALIKAEFEQAQRACETAQARLAIARHEVDARTILAPAAGRILRCLVKAGEGVSTQSPSPLFWLAPDGPLTVRAQLDEQSAHLVTPGESAQIVPDSSNTSVATARVLSVGLAFGPRRPATDDPAERQDLRVVDCLLVVDGPAPDLMIGQRVVVRFLKSSAAVK